MKLQQIKVWAFVKGEEYSLVGIVDGNLQRITAWRPIAGIKKPSSKKVTDYKWRKWCSNEKRSWVKFNEGRREGWPRKISTWQSSFRLRAVDRQFRRRAEWTRLDGYGTHTWDDAIARMWEQGHSKYRYHTRSGWERWCASVANNSNKRSGGRYAKKVESPTGHEHRVDHSNPTASPAGESAVQMRFDWDGLDPGDCKP